MATSKVMETCRIPQNDFSILDLGDEFCSIVTIPTNPEILENPQG
jgi:hypothetical protein